MTLESLNEAVVRRFFTSLERGDIDGFDRLIADDYAHHVPGIPAGREPFKLRMAALRLAFPDLLLPIIGISADGDTVCVLNRVQGTHDGDFGPYKASGRRIDVSAFHRYRLSDGLLVEHREVFDQDDLEAQIAGATPRSLD